jgi:hypothetical protein
LGIKVILIVDDCKTQTIVLLENPILVSAQPVAKAINTLQL